MLSQSESGNADKLAAITRVINFGLDTIMSERSVRVHQLDRPWLNPDLKQLIHKRQKAFSPGNTQPFKLLRNKVNHERKRDIYAIKTRCRT